jgi:uncharacterized protein
MAERGTRQAGADGGAGRRAEPRPPERVALNVLRIPADGELEEEGELAGEVLELEKDPVARSAGAIRWKLRAQFAGSEILVRGEAEAPVELRCAKCGRFFSTSVAVSSFLRAYERGEHPESLDVTEDLREEVLLELPAFPRCAPGCKGRCAQCGKDLNEGPCGCVPPKGFDAWSALDGLVLGKDGPEGDGKHPNGATK